MTRPQLIEALRRRVQTSAADAGERAEAQLAYDAAVAAAAARGITNAGQLDVFGRNAREAVVVRHGKTRQIPRMLAHVDARRPVPLRDLEELERLTRPAGDAT